MKKIIIVASLILLTSATALATPKINTITGDYRPQYSFLSSEYNPFVDLESFPDDFWDIRTKFATQSVLASKLGKAYYQPELLQPSWNASCEDWYSNNGKNYDFQGIFVYPSRFDVYNIHNGDTLTVSAFIYAHPCVSTYQGTEVYLTYNEEAVDVELLTDDVYVLGPTYPVFDPKWIQIIEFKLTILDENISSEIAVREHDPPYDFNQAMKDTYGRDNYSACQELLSEKMNRCTVFLYSEAISQNESKDNSGVVVPFEIIVGGVIGGCITVLLLVLWLKYGIRRRRRRNQEDI